MRLSRRLIYSLALVALVLGVHRWVQPPSSQPTILPAVLEAASLSPLTAPLRTAFSAAELAQIRVKQLNFFELPIGAQPNPEDTAFPWRSRNSPKSGRALQQDSHSLDLRNAVIDTASSVPIAIPHGLLAGAEPGFHLVQSARSPDLSFRHKIEAAGLRIISYIPNNAFLVQGTTEDANRLALDPEVVALPAWQPSFKLEPELLTRVIDGRTLETGERLMISVTDPAALGRLTSVGVQEVTRQRSPFGLLVTVEVPVDSLVVLAQSPDIHLIEKARDRELLNDRSGFLLGSATDLTNTLSYEGLTGSNVVINVNDSGIDWKHPDLVNRVSTVGSATNLLSDVDGHGTHVAGTIAGSGSKSSGVKGPVQGSVTNANFRGHAPEAKLFILPIDLKTGPTLSDVFLQEQAARTNALISNNSWSYNGVYGYNSISASYDAASRDALPDESGEQPVLFVFAAGNSGGGGENGVGGLRGSISAPGNAKNVITVGALESQRKLTNSVIIDQLGRVVWAGGHQFRTPLTNDTLKTNLVLRASSDTDTEVADYSSRGNVSVGIEGDFGRFKPDVVAPGSQILSARSSQWSLGAEYDTNSVQYALFEDLNRPVEPFYRFLSGTSMAAPAISGVLAQIQEFWERPNRSIPKYAQPAAFKAMLINSARVTSDTYVPNFRATMNYSGWGRPNLPRALDSGVRVTRPGGGVAELAGFSGDLFTGASYLVRLRPNPTDVATNAPFHMTLVWTDPPGNPAAGVKLVNDLDLIVSNTVTGEVFVGNSFDRAGLSLPYPGTNVVEVVEEGVTNSVFDAVNNVERVILPPPLSSEYVIQIFARRVNVNALSSRIYKAPAGATAGYLHPAYATNIVQDFVVAISSDASSSNSVVATAEFLTEETAALVRVQPSEVTAVQTNGVPISAGRVGANSPLFGGLNGQSNQWHFFTFTNLFDPIAAQATGLTNGRYVEFAISSGVNLARPRGTGQTGRKLRDPELGPDLDLYMSKDPGLMLLTPLVVASAQRSAQQGSGERIEVTNAPANGEVYYIAVKSEDQQAGEFELIVRSSDQPFSKPGPNGLELLMTPIGGSRVIPEGSPDVPGVIRYFGSGPSGLVRNVTLIQSLFHDNFPDLQGTLIHQGYGATINNRRAIRDLGTGQFVVNGGATGLFDDIPGLRFAYGQPTDGPSTSLLDFAGLNVGGAWNYLLQDDVLGASGSLNSVQIQVQPERLTAFDTIEFETVCLGPKAYDFRLRLVPPDASRFIIQVTNLLPKELPLEVYVRREAFPDPANPDINDRVATITSPSGLISISIRDVPPLQSGVYFVLFHNPSAVTLCFDVALYGERNLSGRFTSTLSGTSTNLSDVAQTLASIQVKDGRPVSDMDVAVRLGHDRVSDLALRLKSPAGLETLLFENRGLTATNGLGGVLLSSNYQHVAVTFDRVAQRAVLYFNGEEVATGFVPFTATNQADSFRIGHSPSKIYAEQAVRLDDIGLWRRPLRGDEVRRIYDEGLFGRGKLPIQAAQGLVSLWPFDGSGMDVIGGASATLSGTTGTAGQVGRGLTFRGPGVGSSSNPGLVTNSQVTQLSSQVAFSLDAWVRPVSGNQSVVVAGWFNSGSKVFGPVLLAGYPAPLGNGPGSLSVVFIDATGDRRVISSAPGLFTASGIITNRAFAVFSDRTNGVYTPIKFAQPPYLSRVSSATVVSNDWETLPAGRYGAGTNLIEGWEVLTNNVEVLGSGGQEALVLDLKNASILRRYDFNTGQDYSAYVTMRTSPKASNLVSVEFQIDGVGTVSFNGSPDWTTNRVNFVATTGRTALGIRAVLPAASDTNQLSGLEIGRVWINQSGSVLTYQPEEPLRPLAGRSGLGDWRLSMTDARGDVSGSLIDWQLRLTFMPTNAAAVRLANGIAYTTNLIGDQPRYFIVDVPLEAERATNLLTNLSGGPLYLLYSETGLPDLTESTDVLLGGPISAGGQLKSVLNTSLPPLLPRGQRYYMAVRSVDPGASNLFSLRVDLGVRITPLTNGISVLATNTSPSLTDYFSFTVSTNDVLGVTFSLTSPSANVDLVAIRAPFLPRLNQFDYLSSNLGLSNESIAISRTSLPVPLSPGLWYLGVVNVSGVAPVVYTLIATEQSGSPQQLVPGVVRNGAQTGVVPDYFYVDVPEGPIGLRVSVNSLDSRLILSGRRELPLPTLTIFDYQTGNSASTNKDLVITIGSQPVPLSQGRWYFSVSGRSGFSSPYSIVAELSPSFQDLLPLSDGFSFLAASTGGPGVQDFFFSNPGPVTALAFEIYDLTGPADLQVSSDNPLPISQVFYSNIRPDMDPELVVLRAGNETNSLARDWYLRVTLPSTNRMSFRVRAKVGTDGLPPIEEVLILVPVAGADGSIAALRWQSIAGERYRIDVTTSLIVPIVWTPISTNAATSGSTQVEIPSAPVDQARYFRVLQLP